MKKLFRRFSIIFVTLLMILPFIKVKGYEYDNTKSEIPGLRVFEDGTIKYDKSQFYDLYVSLKYEESNNYLTSIFQTTTDESFNIIDLLEEKCTTSMNYAFNCRDGIEGTYDLLIRSDSNNLNSEFTFTYHDGKITGSIVEQKYTLTILTNEPTCKVLYNSKTYNSGDTLILEEGAEVRFYAQAGSGYRFADAVSDDTTITVNGSVGRIINMPKKNATITFLFNPIPEYEASLDSIDLGHIVKGYNQNDYSQIFRVNVTGTSNLNSDANHFKVEFTGGNTEAFVLWVNNGGTFNSGSTYNAGSIKPAENLSKGTYQATYTLYYDEDGEGVESDFTELANETVSLKVSDQAYNLTILTNEPTCKVLYNSKEYSNGDIISIPDGEEVRLYAKSPNGFVFTNAVSSDVSITPNGSVGRIIVMPEKDVTITFNFTKYPIVIFNTNGGSEIESQIANYNPYYVEMPEDPIKDGYIFMGWYIDESFKNEFDFDIPYELTTDLTLYAKWKSNFEKPTAKLTANNDKLTISWDQQLAATKYEVYRSENNKTWKKVSTTESISFTDKGLKYNKTYYYKVRAYNGTKWTGYSNIVKKKVVPNKVGNLTIKSASTNNIKLTWDKVNTTGYEIYRSENNKKWTKVATITKNSTLEYNNKKLKANKTYYYKVRAYKTVSGKKIYGSYSSVVSTKTAPSKPSLKVTIKDYNSMNLSIGSVKGASAYQVQGSMDGKAYSLIEVLPTSGVLAQEGHDFGVTYYYRLRACNTQNNCSGWVSVNLKQTTASPKVTLKTTSKRITTTVSSVNGADGYKLYMSMKKNGKYEMVKEFTSVDELLEYTMKTYKGYTYYYKAKSYKIVDGNKVYSPFGGIKSIKSK